MVPVEGTESTVHGFPAVVTSSGLADALNADNVTFHVEWSEHDSRFAIDTTGIGPGATVELANSSAVVGHTISLDLASIPDGFELVDTSETRAGDTFPMVTLVAAPRELDHSGAIFTNLVNGAGSLDAVVGRESERRVVDGVEYSILVESPGTANERTTIEWLRDGHTFSTFGRIEVDTLLDFAAGLTPATPDEVERAKLATADLALAIPEYASATLSTGDDVSVRAAEGSNRARALCLTDATPECFRLYFDFNDSVTVSGFYRVFNDSGKRRIVGWHASAPGTITASNDAPVEIVQGSEGWFVTFAVADGAPLPVLDYENGTGYISENDWP